MIRYLFSIAALAAACFSAIAFAGEPAKTGIIKGTITIGGRPTADAVVSVEGVPQEQNKTQLSGGKPKAVMEQKDLKFIPRVLAVLVQTTVDFPNQDKTFHNVYSNSEAKKFDLGLYPSGKSRSVTFDKAGVVKILCNAHPNMEAYVVVKNHPYFAVADARGNYSLNGIPLGKYRVEVWHPELGTRTTPVELVREGEVLAINVDLKKQ
jgi:plastocyanin